jgi:hypothetical protein
MSAVYKVVQKPFHTIISPLKHPLSSDRAILCIMTILCMTCALVSDVTQPSELINISAFVSDGTLKAVLSIRSKYPRSHIILLHVMSTVDPTIWLFLYSRVLFQKLMRPQLVKFPALYEKQRFIPVFTRARSIHFTSPPSYFLKNHFNIVFPSTPRSSKWSPFLMFPHLNRVRTSFPICPTCHTHLILLVCSFERYWIRDSLKIMKPLITYSPPLILLILIYNGS